MRAVSDLEIDGYLVDVRHLNLAEVDMLDRAALARVIQRVLANCEEESQSPTEFGNYI
jgi:hypothetical protein